VLHIGAALALATCASVPAALAGTADTVGPGTVSVHVRGAPRTGRAVHISFTTHLQLPAGGYYYAVMVLGPYRHHTNGSPPACATSSDMQRADYGYRRADGTVHLTLTPARSRTGGWCHGGSYAGAVYAVPHPPPCEAHYPCRSEPYEPPSPCFKLGEGHVACGVVALPPHWTYPNGVPAPISSGTRIVGRFGVSFR
jgi:hypothetical protein